MGNPRMWNIDRMGNTHSISRQPAIVYSNSQYMKGKQLIKKHESSSGTQYTKTLMPNKRMLAGNLGSPPASV